MELQQTPTPSPKSILGVCNDNIAPLYCNNLRIQLSKEQNQESYDECSTTIYDHHLLELSSCNLQKMNTLKH